MIKCETSITFNENIFPSLKSLFSPLFGTNFDKY